VPIEMARNKTDRLTNVAGVRDFSTAEKFFNKSASRDRVAIALLNALEEKKTGRYLRRHPS